MKRAQDLKGNPSVPAGRNTGPKFTAGALCVWCGTRVFTSSMPRPMGTRRWAHGGGCADGPLAHELKSWTIRQLERRGVEPTEQAVSEEMSAFEHKRQIDLLNYLAYAMRDGADDAEQQQLERSLPVSDPTPLILQAMDIAGETETTGWLREDRFWSWFEKGDPS